MHIGLYPTFTLVMRCWRWLVDLLAVIPQQREGEQDGNAVDGNQRFTKTPIKRDVLISWVAGPKGSEDPKSKRSAASGCFAGGLTVSGNVKSPSGSKTCCSCPVYTNNLLSGA